MYIQCTHSDVKGMQLVCAIRIGKLENRDVWVVIFRPWIFSNWMPSPILFPFSKEPIRAHNCCQRPRYRKWNEKETICLKLSSNYSCFSGYVECGWDFQKLLSGLLVNWFRWWFFSEINVRKSHTPGKPVDPSYNTKPTDRSMVANVTSKPVIWFLFFSLCV